MLRTPPEALDQSASLLTTGIDNHCLSRQCAAGHQDPVTQTGASPSALVLFGPDSPLIQGCPACCGVGSSMLAFTHQMLQAQS